MVTQRAFRLVTRVAVEKKEKRRTLSARDARAAFGGGGGSRAARDARRFVRVAERLRESVATLFGVGLGLVGAALGGLFRHRLRGLRRRRAPASLGTKGRFPEYSLKKAGLTRIGFPRADVSDVYTVDSLVKRLVLSRETTR